MLTLLRPRRARPEEDTPAPALSAAPDAQAVVRRIAAQPFNVSFWAFSFPLAAFSVLTLRLAELGQIGAMQTAGVLMLAISSIAILWLCFPTYRGLRDGSLLAPEPVASITPVAG